MLAYSFKARFVDPILSGRKPHTIRSPRQGRSRHARPGEVVQLYREMRNKKLSALIGDASCTGVEPVMIWPAADTIQIAGAEALDHVALDEFAVSDGFDDWADMRAFWLAVYGSSKHDMVLIRWDPASLVRGPVFAAWKEPK